MSAFNPTCRYDGAVIIQAFLSALHHQLWIVCSFMHKTCFSSILNSPSPASTQPVSLSESLHTSYIRMRVLSPEELQGELEEQKSDREEDEGDDVKMTEHLKSNPRTRIP